MKIKKIIYNFDQKKAQLIRNIMGRITIFVNNTISKTTNSVNRDGSIYNRIPFSKKSK